MRGRPGAATSTNYIQEQDISTAFPPWLLPFEQRKDFVGRDLEMEELERILFAPKAFGRVALTGLGGMGKSRLAMEIAYRTKLKRPSCSIFWIQATDLSSIRRGFRDIAEALKLQVSGATDLERLEVVRKRLSEDEMGEWLLILDDADNNNVWLRRKAGDSSVHPVLLDYIPQSTKGAVLVTTRSRQLAVRIAQGRIIQLEMLNNRESVELLMSRLNQPTFGQESDSEELALLLTCLPFALIRAADVANELDIDVSALLRHLREDEETVVELLHADSEDIEQLSKMKPSPKRNWLFSIDRIQQQDHHAFELLVNVACLDYQMIPHSMLPIALPSLYKEKTLALLVGYGILRKDQQKEHEASFKMHRLAYFAVRSWLHQTDSFHERVRVVAVHLINFLESIAIQTVTKPISTLYLLHAHHLYSSSNGLTIEERFKFLRLTRPLLQTEIEHKQSLSHWRQLASDVKTSTLQTFNFSYFDAWFGHVLHKQGLLKEAEPYLRAVYEQTFPELDTSSDKEARTFRRSTHTQDFPESDSEVSPFTFITELIETYQLLGPFGSVEPMAEHLVEYCVRQFGHTDCRTQAAVIIWVDICMVPRWITDKFTSATITKLERLIDVSDRSFGQRHIQTAKAKFTLADFYLNTKSHCRAVELLSQVHDVFENALGINNSLTLASKMSLAREYSRTCRWQLVEQLFPKSFPILKTVNGWLDGTGKRDFPISLAKALLALCRCGRGQQRYMTEICSEVFGESSKFLPDDPSLEILVEIGSRLLKHEFGADGIAMWRRRFDKLQISRQWPASSFKESGNFNDLNDRLAQEDKESTAERFWNTLNGALMPDDKTSGNRSRKVLTEWLSRELENA